MSTADYQAFSKFLSQFSGLPCKRRKKTLLEISRFPHSEIACSNILAFFFDPNEEHGLGDLLLKSLLAAAGKPAAASKDFKSRSPRPCSSLGSKKNARILLHAISECGNREISNSVFFLLLQGRPENWDKNFENAW